jgi:hypothetical protein
VVVRLSDPVLGALEEGRQAYVAVPSRNGPHVTPELYTWSGDRLWFATAAETLKAKVLKRSPVVGAVVTTAGRSVILAGSAAVYDARDPRSLLGRRCELPGAARAIAGFTARNAADLLAFVGDTAAGRLGWRVPPPRVLFALRPDRAAFVENDLVTECSGWSCDDGDKGGGRGGGSAGSEPPVGGERAVAAFPGPVPLPGRWFADEQRFHVQPHLLDMLGLDDEFPMSVVVDDYSAPGPAAKQGTLVRGQGSRSAQPGFVEVDAERLVEWDGVETSSTAAG